MKRRVLAMLVCSITGTMLAQSGKLKKASASYIKSKITNPERIYGKGYGESNPLNNCGCEGKNNPCTEEEHYLISKMLGPSFFSKKPDCENNLALIIIRESDLDNRLSSS